MRVLITGGAGQLAQAFKRRLVLRGDEVFAPSRAELDVTDSAALSQVVSSFRPKLVINCAAYNLVDKAEEEFERAFAVNALAVAALAHLAREKGFFLVHFSTDYVFDGEKKAPYTEEDQPFPLNKYGLSKRLGELALEGLLSDRALLFRVSWVYGQGKQNFLAKLLTWAEGKESLHVSCDEFSVPTYSETIVTFALKAYERGLSGLYHLVNRGFCSRFEWARAFFSLLGSGPKVFPVRAESFNLPAKRPFFSALSPARLEAELGEEIPSWEEDLKRFVKEVKEAGL